ncbi:hypothetical protein, partial [Stenotrophomonas sp. 3diitr2024]|uniref:DUF6630 family protein n=1 Tax=Stenotrophomonas sp. 3diitr2024 TaxID=3345115 RepID=UPI0035C9AE81
MPDNSDYFDFEEDIHDFDEDGFEARVWNLLVLINPGDEELALQQFNRWREHLSEDGQPLEADSDWLPALFTAIAWQSGFEVERDDLESLQSAVNELSARFNLQLDWGGDLDDEDFAEDLDGVQLMSTAFDRLREHNYTLWSVDTGSDGFTGVMALTRDQGEGRFVVIRGLDANLNSVSVDGIAVGTP